MVGLHLFHGGEQFLVERAFNEAWTRLTAGLQSELDAEILDSESSPAEVAVAVGSVGFFSTGRVVGTRDWPAPLPRPGRKRESAKPLAPNPPPPPPRGSAHL